MASLLWEDESLDWEEESLDSEVESLDSASSSFTFKSHSYDVFLNFRGEDTRNNFTGFLHKALTEGGIHVFMDSKNLQTGEAIGPELLSAIEISKISIPVLSKDYANSKWCLLELAQIVKCHRSKDHQLVFPIFFHVDPSDVLDQTGSFEEAFREHEMNFDSDTVNSWRDALRVVGSLKGEVIHKDKDQVELIDLVVGRVLANLFSCTHFPESKHPAGLDWASSLLSSDSTSTTERSSYDVFINFRGEDTRNNFTGSLDQALRDRGINAFIGIESMRTGDAIVPTLERTIKESKISIPVFSKGYAHSKKRLKELAQIVQCHRSNGQLVLPIFFHVHPSDVRNQTGSFEEAFREHEKTLEPDTVKSWREALRVVGNLKGEVLDKTKDQAKLVDLVVKRILAECVHPAGLDWASSSSSTASTTGCSSYDVFLNFMGEDTRNKIAGSLDKALRNRGINAFIGIESMRTGEAIGPALLRAIEGSKVSIPVFSKGYAHSKKRLLELAQIVQCHRSNGQLVLPIFFHVHPSDVRNQTGSFEEAFREHEKTFEPDTVKSWREALRVIGNLKGEVVDKTKDQAELVESVVERVLAELISSTHLAECKHPVGLVSPVNDLLSLLSIGSNDVQFVGICGFGGIGKTTIAKAVYNLNFLKFSRHSFLSDVREQATQCMGLVSLQKRLLKDVFKIDIDIADDHRGKKVIEERLCKQNILLVLDDVDSKEQVDALAGAFNWFGQGSRVIITTRDENILNVAKVDKDKIKIYRPQVLDLEQSRQLFSWHAFSRDQPPEDYMQLSNDVASYSDGLPLTLEVLGSYLSEISSTEEWESTIKKLKEIPHEKIQKRLKISYDKLEDEYQKAMFLDAACLFIGWEKETVISIWEACGYYPHSTIQRLIKRSLLKFEGTWFDKYCYLRMHDQIRDMGREIVLQESRSEPGKRSRLWSYVDILEVLEGRKGTEIIQGFAHHSSIGRFDAKDFEMISNLRFYAKDFEMMPNLRFLDAYSANIGRDFSCLPSGLRWFRWNCCPIPPTNFYHKRLVYLDLSDSNIKQAWNIRSRDENKRFQKLKVLDFSNCRFLCKSPHFSWFPYLERLDLRHCDSLDKLDKSIGQLSQLKSLILSECRQIKELPKSIGDLKFLVKLDLSWTMIEELPDNICRLSYLKELILEFCESLYKLPESIGDLKSLVVLQLHDCFGIEGLPDSVGLLEKLEVLDAYGCYKLVKSPRSMQRMRCLHSINLKGTRISKLPDDFSMLPNLVELKMSGWLHSFPANLSHLKKLKQLKFCECEKLEYLRELPPSFVELYCPHCYSMVLPDLSRLKILTRVLLDDCKNVEEIRGFEGTKSLVELDATGCYNLAVNPRKIHGQVQGAILPNRSRGNRILLLVLEFPSYLIDNLEFEQLTVDLDISASIHQEDKTISCLHTLRIEDFEFTNRDIIYIHHFNGFEWFGIPLQNDDAIEILYIRGFYLNKFRVKLNWSYVGDMLLVSAPNTSRLIIESQMPFYVDQTIQHQVEVQACTCSICQFFPIHSFLVWNNGNEMDRI